MQGPRRVYSAASQSMNVAFDSRAGKDSHGVGRYARSLLAALRSSGRGDVVETHSPRRTQVSLYHSPWLDGALLHSPVPMVVTVHDLIALKKPSEVLRHGVRMRMRYLATQRAARVIVPTRVVADDVMHALHIPGDRIDVIPEAAAPVFRPRPQHELDDVRSRYELARRVSVVGRRAEDAGSAQASRATDAGSAIAAAGAGRSERSLGASAARRDADR